MNKKIIKSEKEWKEVLDLDQFYVTRQKGTEVAFTGQYWDNHKTGNYFCVCCGNIVFNSGSKFDSGSGWPSFSSPALPQNVEVKPDFSLGMERLEVICTNCNAHLGHVFDDGPQPTGLRYCINSRALNFKEK